MYVVMYWVYNYFHHPFRYKQFVSLLAKLTNNWCDKGVMLSLPISSSESFFCAPTLSVLFCSTHLTTCPMISVSATKSASHPQVLVSLQTMWSPLHGGSQDRTDEGWTEPWQASVREGSQCNSQVFDNLWINRYWYS